MTSQIDYGGINAAALRCARSLLPDLIPGGKFRSLEYVVRNPGRRDQNPCSFCINYKSGVWKDFATDEGGRDFISLWASIRGTGQGDAAREVAERLGVPLYRSNGVAIASPYVSTAIDPFDPELREDQIFWPAGEKDVDTLSRLNLPAFTFGGVGDGLPSGIDEYLTGRHLVILADNDDRGFAHAENKAERANTAGAISIRIVHFPELPPKADVSDFIAAGGTAEQLIDRASAAALWNPGNKLAHWNLSSEPAPTDRSNEADKCNLVMRCMADVQPEKIEWLWPRRIALGKQTLIGGEPGLGKSQITAALAAAVTTGGTWPCDEGRAPPGSVLILSAEDDAGDTIRPRLDAAGADVSAVYLISAVRQGGGKGRRTFNLQADLALLEAAIGQIGNVRLVIIDPVSSYLGKLDSHKNADVRGALEPLGDMASRLRVAVVSITHFSKGAGQSAVNSFIGSIAFVAAARAAFIVTRDPDSDNPARRLFIRPRTI